MNRPFSCTAVAGVFVLLAASLECTRALSAPTEPESDSGATLLTAEPGPSPSLLHGPGYIPPARLAASGAPPSASAAPGTPVANNSCTPGKDSVACTPDGLNAVTCAGGLWRQLQSCKGPAHCKGVGSALTCDTGIPQPGEACAAAASEPHCRSAHEAIVCQGGTWTVSACAPGALCMPGAAKGHAGCK